MFSVLHALAIFVDAEDYRLEYRIGDLGNRQNWDKYVDCEEKIGLGRAVQSVGTIGSHAILGGLHHRYAGA
jgi:hypothetical protein